MAGRPLSPAIRLGLGGPLPHLLADRTRVSQIPDCSFYPEAYGVLADVSICCPPVSDKSSRVTHPSATKLRLKQAFFVISFDLHVLGTPPAFVLSQDQTLNKFYLNHRFPAAKTDLPKSFFLASQKTSKTEFYTCFHKLKALFAGA